MAARKQQLDLRFWSKVKFTDGCWEWQGSKQKPPRPYGRFYLDGKAVLAHRLAWELHHHRKFPADKLACHTCNNPPCVRPDHVYPGTHSTNMQDALRAGYKNLTNTKLTKEQADVIRIEYATGRWTQAELGIKFGVHQVNISKIVRGGQWA